MKIQSKKAAWVRKKGLTGSKRSVGIYKTKQTRTGQTKRHLSYHKFKVQIHKMMKKAIGYEKHNTTPLI